MISARTSLFTASMATLAAVMATPAFAADDTASAQQGEHAESAGAAGNDIIVTARRREERLADVPVSVTALGEDALKAAQVVTPKELSNFVPSLNVNTGNAREGNRFTLRGQGATLAAGEAVVTYLA